jgi:hypothetical protein
MFTQAIFMQIDKWKATITTQNKTCKKDPLKPKKRIERIATVGLAVISLHYAIVISYIEILVAIVCMGRKCRCSDCSFTFCYALLIPRNVIGVSRYDSKKGFFMAQIMSFSLFPLYYLPHKSKFPHSQSFVELMSPVIGAICHST